MKALKLAFLTRRRLSKRGPLMTPQPDDHNPEAIAPWMNKGSFRRDCHPERGRLLMAFVTTGLLCAICSVCCAGMIIRDQFERPPQRGIGENTTLAGGAVVLGFLGLIPSVAAWRLARNDYKQIETGERDPEGEAKTKNAVEDGKVCTVMNAVGLILGSLLFAYFLFRVFQGGIL